MTGQFSGPLMPRPPETIDVGLRDVELLRSRSFDLRDPRPRRDVAELERLDARRRAPGLRLGGEDVRPRRRDLERRRAAIHLGARLARVDGPRRRRAGRPRACSSMHVRQDRDVVAGGEARRHVLAHRGRGDQHRVRRFLPDRGVERADVPLVAVERELVPVGHVDDPGAVRPELLARDAATPLPGITAATGPPESFRASDSASSEALRILPSRCSMKTRNFIVSFSFQHSCQRSACAG